MGLTSRDVNTACVGGTSVSAGLVLDWVENMGEEEGKSFSEG